MSRGTEIFFKKFHLGLIHLNNMLVKVLWKQGRLEQGFGNSFLQRSRLISSDWKMLFTNLRQELFPLRGRLGRLLQLGSRCGDSKAEVMCRNLLKLWPALLTFAFVPGVEPTNNRAKRALRGAVLWHKGCFGNQSENHSRFTERILTTVAILRQQDRNIVEYVVAAIQAQ